MHPGLVIAIFGWIPLLLAVFRRTAPRRAVLLGFVVGSLLLPVYTYRIQGLPDYSKALASCGGVFLVTALFDLRTLLSYRPSWWDLSAVFFCLSPFVSAIHGNLGLHEGLSVIFQQAVTWGIPYFLGAVYFRKLETLRELATALFYGGLAYVPFCILEFVVGPKLHLWAYGFVQNDVQHTATRFGGWRPMVFMESGLEVAVWMAAATIVGFWLLKSGAMPERLGRVRSQWLVWLLFATAVWMKSVNGWVLLILGYALLTVSFRLRTRAVLYANAALVVAMVAAGASGRGSREWMVDIVSSALNAERGRSISFRFQNEEVIASNARERLLWGWGRTPGALLDREHKVNPNLPPEQPAYAIVDSLWIGIFAQFGLMGLAGWLALMLTPALLFSARVHPSEWMSPAFGGAAALAIVLLLYVTDHLANGFIQPFFMLAAGGLVRCAGTQRTLPGQSAIACPR